MPKSTQYPAIGAGLAGREHNGAQMIPFDQLDPFTQGYLEAAMWTDEPDEVIESTPEWNYDNLAPEALEGALRDCKAFQLEAADPLRLLDSEGDDQHGHDFWLTRNGHGAGFWDRGYGVTGKVLTDIADKYGMTDLYLGDDGKLYFSR